MESRSVSFSDVPALLIIRGVVLMLVALGLVGGLHVWLAHRMVDGAGATGVVASAGYAVFAALFVSIPAGFAAGRRRPSLRTKAVLWISHLWIGVFGLLVTVTGVAELVRVGFALTGSAAAWTPAYTAWVAGVTAALAVWGVAVARGRIQVRRLCIPVKGLGEGLRGVRIVQISDIHIGQTLGSAFLKRIVDQVNALQPDIVAVTGDLVDGFVNTTKAEVASIATLRAPLGVFYVSGNHEYYYGGPAWEAEVRRLGLTVLRNEHRIVEREGARLVIAGVTDHDAGQFGDEHASRPDLALAGAPAELPRVLLAHQPRTALKVRGERVDLQLSGHTHGGQIYPFNVFVLLQQPVVAGLKEIAGVRVYTHRGTGYWGPPMRVGPAPEIAVLELVPKSAG